MYDHDIDVHDNDGYEIYMYFILRQRLMAYWVDIVRNITAKHAKSSNSN